MRLLQQLKNILIRNDAVVLMYHRIGEEPIDPWQLSVSEANFEQQLQVLKKEYNIISVNELLNQITTSSIKKKNVCITFDDGYFDNFSRAAPLLKKYDCPATFYITTGYTNQEKLFWWDLLAEIFLSTNLLPKKLEFGPFSFTLDNNGYMTTEQFNLHKSWKYPHPAPTQRGDIYMTLWQYLKYLPEEELAGNIDILKTWAKMRMDNIENARPMNDRELASLSSEELFSLGAHTVSHPALGSQSPGAQQLELRGSRSYLSGNNNYSDTVAYPYGSYNEETINIMRNEKFKAGFTTEEKAVNIKSDIYKLGRFQVKDWTGPEFKDQLNQWTRN